jgi:hypothetical protein
MAISDEGFVSAVNEKWKQMLGQWMKVVFASDVAGKVGEWNEFKRQYGDGIFEDLIAYIESEWLDRETARQFLYCYTRNSLTVGSAALSHGTPG